MVRVLFRGTWNFFKRKITSLANKICYIYFSLVIKNIGILQKNVLVKRGAACLKA